MTNEDRYMALIGYEMYHAEICAKIAATKRRIRELGGKVPNGTTPVRAKREVSGPVLARREVSEETRRAMSLAQKRRWRKLRRKGVA